MHRLGVCFFLDEDDLVVTEDRKLKNIACSCDTRLELKQTFEIPIVFFDMQLLIQCPIVLTPRQIKSPSIRAVTASGSII